MALTLPHHATNSAVAAILAAGALLAAACAAAPPISANIEDELICTPDDLRGTYFMQMAGEFSIRNLADLADDAASREAELDSSGLRGGRFNYWKQDVGKPPFETPVELVCQVMEFASDAQAAQFVRDLEVDPGELATTAVAWLPAGGRTARELPVSDTAYVPPGTRVFRLEGTSPGANTILYAAIAPGGRFVQGIYMGNRDGTATPGETTAVLARLAARSNPSAFAR